MVKKLLSASVCYGLIVAPLHAGTSRANRPEAVAPSLLEAAEIAAASGVYRAQNTATISTGRIRQDDKKRSALAFAISGVAAFAGAGLWRWLPCRNVTTTPTNNATEATKFVKCYHPDGQRKGLETPTKLLLGAGVALELVSLGYFIAHLTSERENP